METLTVMSFNLKRDLLPFGPHAWQKPAASSGKPPRIFWAPRS